MVSIGIDVAKDKHDCFILNSERDILADVLTIPNNMEGFFILLGKILECTSPQDKIKVRLEATGQQLQHSRISSWKRSTHLWIPCAQIPTVRVLALERQNQPGRCANNWGYAFARCRLKPLHRYSIPSAYPGTGRRNWRYWSGHSVHHGWSAFSNYNYSGHWLPNECHDSGRSGGFSVWLPTPGPLRSFTLLYFFSHLFSSTTIRSRDWFLYMGSVMCFPQVLLW